MTDTPDHIKDLEAKMADNMIEREKDEVMKIDTSIIGQAKEAIHKEMLEQGQGGALISISDSFAEAIARSVIETMREPSMDMVVDALDNAPVSVDGRCAEKMWQAMIDAALNEDGNG